MVWVREPISSAEYIAGVEFLKPLGSIDNALNCLAHETGQGLARVPNATESEGIFPKLRFGLVVKGNPQVLRNVVPGRGALQPELSTRWPLRVLGWAMLVIVVTVPVLYPHLYISKHVVETKTVRHLESHIVRGVAVVMESLIENFAASSVLRLVVIL